MASAGKEEIGQLIIIVVKARNLLNLSLSKQDPVATLQLCDQSSATKSCERGGQHPGQSSLI
jgi:hypothetical protein